MIKRLLILVLLASSVFAKKGNFDKQQLRNLINSDSRIVVDLSGSWNLTTESGSKKTVEVPAGIKTNEKLVYEKTIKIDRQLIKTKTWQLYFLGVNSDLEIYVNGQYIGRFLCAMTPLKVPIPTKYLDGDNVELKLIINPSENFTKLNNEFGLLNKVNYNGIVRDLFFVGTSKIWLDQVNFSSDYDLKNDRAKINASFKINSAQIEEEEFTDKPVSVNLQLFDPSTGSVVFERTFNEKLGSERSTIKKFDFQLSSPRLWSHSEPNLYDLRIQLNAGDHVDDITNKVGIRDFEIKDENSLMFNGKQIFIKSVDYIEDYNGSYGSFSANVFEEDILQLKKLGVNTIRYKFVSPHPYMVSLCDKYGILIFSDEQIGRVPKVIYNSDEIQVRLENISKMTEASYGHNPSIISWGNSFYNFKRNQSEHKSYLNYRVVKIEDPFETSDDKFLIIEIDNSLLTIEDIKSRINFIKSKFNGPILINPGSTVQIENNNGYSDRLSLDYQANWIRNLFLLSRSEELAGISINAFNDYDLHYPLLVSNNKNKYKATIGLVDNKRKPRISYQTLSALLNGEKEPLLNSGSWVDKTNYLFIIIGFVVIVALLFLLNRLRRFREYFIRSLIRPYNFYSDVRDQRLISTIQTFILSIFISFTLGIYLTDILYYHRFNLDTEYFLMLLIRDASILENVYDLIWKPEVLMLILSSVVFLFFYILASFLKIISLFVRSRIFFHDTLTITVWSAIPTIFLLPPALISNRLLSIHPAATLVFLVLFLVFTLWYLSRLMKSTSVVFDIPIWKSYTLGTGILIIVSLLFLSIYQINYSFIDYFKMFLSSIG